MMDMGALLRETLANPIFSGVAGGSLILAAVTYLGYQLRALPGLLFTLVRSQVTVELTLYGDQPAFQDVNMWLSRHPSTQKARRLMAVTEYDGGGDNGEHRLTLGSGPHLVKQGGRHWLITRSVNMPTPQGSGGATPVATGMQGGRSETLTLTTLGRSPATFRTFLASVRRESEAADSVPIFIWADGWFRPIGRRPVRPMETVFMNLDQRAALLADLRSFLGARQWYAERGIPWRRGVLLEGPPGTGKTSLIFALAGALRRPIYLVNPSTLSGDAHLQAAMTGARDGILVLEDIDAAFAARDRAVVSQGDFGAMQMREPITLSGLLNAIDGIGAQDGRILFLTSNYPDKLDAALLRPGRVDRRERLGLAGEDVARAMFTSFFPSGDADAFVAHVASDLPLAPADLQNRLLGIASAQQSSEVIHSRVAA